MCFYTLRFLVNWKEIGYGRLWDHHLMRRLWQVISIRHQETVNLGEVLVMFITFLI